MPKGFAVLGVLAVIFVLTLVAGGVLVWQKVLVLPIQPTPTPDPTVNWKLYTSENLKFTVKYPPNFYLDQDLLTSYSISEAKKGNLPTVNYLKCNFINYDPELFNVKSQTVLRKGPPLIELLVAKDKSLPIDSDTGLFNLYRISQSSKPRIGFLCVSEGLAQDQIINQILSTFKFLDQQTSDVSTGTCIPKFKVEAGPELTASEAYQYRCTEQQNEAGCKLVDIYSKSSKTFGDADGTPDCQWVTSAN